MRLDVSIWGKVDGNGRIGSLISSGQNGTEQGCGTIHAAHTIPMRNSIAGNMGFDVEVLENRSRGKRQESIEYGTWKREGTLFQEYEQVLQGSVQGKLLAAESEMSKIKQLQNRTQASNSKNELKD